MNRTNKGLAVFAVYYCLSDPRAPDNTFRKEVEAKTPELAVKELKKLVGDSIRVRKTKFVRFVEPQPA